MRQIQPQTARRFLALCAVLALLSLSLVLAACDLGGSNNGSANNPTPTATSALNSKVQDANSKAQTAVSGISTAASAVKTANAMSGNDQP